MVAFVTTSACSRVSPRVSSLRGDVKIQCLLQVIISARMIESLSCYSTETRYLNLGPMAATCRFRLLLGPPTLKDRDLCKMVVKISTWSALLYLAISNLCTRNYRQRDKKAKFNEKGSTRSTPH